jgi:hypothetical protein
MGVTVWGHDLLLTVLPCKDFLDFLMCSAQNRSALYFQALA